MALFHGPSMVTSGLVLALDAADINSFDEYENLTLQTSQIGVTPTYSVAGIVGLNTTATTAPNGLYEASTLDNNGNTSANYVFGGASVSLTTNTTYTYSIHIKQGTKPDFQVTIDENGFGGKRYYITFTYSNESVTTGVSGNTGNDGVVVGSNVTKLSNGWYRLSLTFRTSTTAASGFVDMINRFGNTSGSNYLWGRQLELGSTANDYYATTGTAKTRGSTWIDLSGNGNIGTLTNGPTYNIDNGGSIVFDGTNDIVTVPGGGSLNISSTITAMVWVYYISGNGRILQKDGPPYTRLWEIGGYAGTFRMEMWHSNGQATIGYGNPLTVNGWTHLALTFDGTDIKMYQNSTLVSTVNFPGDIRTDVNTPVILGGYWTGEYLNGRISNAQIYNRALTATEIQQNFNETRSRFNI